MILILINFFKISGVRFIIHSRGGPHRLLKQKPNEQGTPTQTGRNIPQHHASTRKLVWLHICHAGTRT